MNTDQKMNGCISISNIEKKTTVYFVYPKPLQQQHATIFTQCIRRLRIASQYLFKQRYRYTLNVVVYETLSMHCCVPWVGWIQVSMNLW